MTESEAIFHDKKKTLLYTLCALAVLFAVFCAGYFFGLRNAGAGVSDNGDGVGHVGEQLGQAVSHQQQITAGIEDAEHTSSAAAGTAQAIAESAHSIEAGVGEAGNLIASSQRILREIRGRTETDTAPR